MAQSPSKSVQRAKNDAFRARCAKGERKEREDIRGSPWVHALSDEKREALQKLIFGYDNWTPETDPTETHASGVVVFEGHYVIWRIRYFDTTPPGLLVLDPVVNLTLLVMHSSEI